MVVVLLLDSVAARSMLNSMIFCLSCDLPADWGDSNVILHRYSIWYFVYSFPAYRQTTAETAPTGTGTHVQYSTTAHYSNTIQRTKGGLRVA
jgi:hypothetical protein